MEKPRQKKTPVATGRVCNFVQVYELPTYLNVRHADCTPEHSTDQIKKYPGGLDLVKSSALVNYYFVRVLLLRFCVIIIYCALN